MSSRSCERGGRGGKGGGGGPSRGSWGLKMKGTLGVSLHEERGQFYVSERGKVQGSLGERAEGTRVKGQEAGVLTTVCLTNKLQPGN